jgi:hypothetical protein
LAEDAEAASSTASEEVSATPPTPRELQLLKLLLFNGDHRAFAAAHLDSAWLTNPAVKRIANRSLRDMEEDLVQGAAFLSEFRDDPAAQSLIGTVLADHHSIPHPEKQIVDVLTNLRNDFLAAELQRLTRELAHPEVSDERRLELLQQQKALRAKRQQPLV